MKKHTLFIRKDPQTLYLPRPTSWLAGLARHKWVEMHLQCTPRIASPQVWKELSQQHEICMLVEDDCGEVLIKKGDQKMDS